MSELFNAEELMEVQSKNVVKETVQEQVNVKEAEVKLATQEKKVVIHPYGELVIKKPTIEDDYFADLVYAEEVNNLIMNSNLPSQDQMHKLLKSKGKWTQEDEDRVNELQSELSTLGAEIAILKAEKGKSSTKKNTLKIVEAEKKFNEGRAEYLRLKSAYNKFMSQTIEGRAEEKKLVAKMSRCVFNASGERMWANPQDLSREKDSEAIGRLVYEFIIFMQGIDPEILSGVPDLLEA